VKFTLVTADAEGSSLSERTYLNTNGSPWTTLEFIRTSGQTDDPLLGCNTQSATILDTHEDATNAALIGQLPVIATSSPGASSLALGITLDHGTTLGGMGLAFGIFIPVDRGDLLPSYGTVQHELSFTTTNGCNYQPPLPLTTQISPLRIGAVPADADPAEAADDNAVGFDEDGITGSFPVYNNNGVYSLTFPVGNTTGSDAFLTGWFDFNRNAQFDPGESVTTVVPANATSATLTWTGLPTWLPTGAAIGYGFRFRLSSDEQATQSATGYAPDGEVEDYLIPSSVLCNVAVTAKPDTAICPGGALHAVASGATQYAWTGGSGISDPSIADPIITPASPATYTVMGSTPQGCQASASIQVTINPLPTVTASNDTTICEGKPVTLTASGGTTNTWTSSNGLPQTTSPSITVSPTTPTTYYVQVTDANGCSSTASIAVGVHSLPVFGLTPATPGVCAGDTIVLTASGGDLYAWSSNAGAIPGSSPLLSVWPAANEDFMVDITDTTCQVSKTLTAHVAVRPLPVTSVTKSNDIDCKVGQATLHATGGIQYVWDPAAGISDVAASDPVVRPPVTTVYRVTVFAFNGCHARDSITVNTDFNSALSQYPIPSAFTPNNDGHNDCFGLKNWGVITTMEMEVFNRWGERVFVSTSPSNCWDGNYKGVPQPAGGYVYQIKATTPCGTAYRKGVVMLIR
jgi:gliding motility-associated-like protein